MFSIEEGQDYENVKEDELPFEHLQNIGFGHSGNVEKVRDKATNAIFARKTIRITTRRLDRQEKSKVFQNEVKIIRALASHHHMIRVFATYSTESLFGLILDPLASHGDLDAYLDSYWRIVDEAKDSDISNPRPNLEAMVIVLEQAFGCLAAGHAFMCEKRIRHRDIKPKNILVHHGHVLYTDFGYSFDSSSFSGSTTEGCPSFLTRKYSAPEVLEYEKKSSKSDVFSLGCVFIELLAALLRSLDSERDIDCYSTRMAEIHEWLRTIEIPTKYSLLPEVIREMTLHERSERPFAKDVVTKLRDLPKLFCEQCSLGRIHLSTPVQLPVRAPVLSLIRPSAPETQQPSAAPDRNQPILALPRLRTYSVGHSLSKNNSHYEGVDPSFYVRSKKFFERGKVFEVISTEPAGTGLVGYNYAMSYVKFGEKVHTGIRRFIVVHQRKTFCYAIPIFTYGQQGTKKLGVVPDEHAIAYSYGHTPTLLSGEIGLSKKPICIVMNPDVESLSPASRIYFGVHHPIQYNVKAKDLGNVHPGHLIYLEGYWNMENQVGTSQFPDFDVEGAYEDAW